MLIRNPYYKSDMAQVQHQPQYNSRDSDLRAMMPAVFPQSHLLSLSNTHGYFTRKCYVISCFVIAQPIINIQVKA